MIRYRCYLEDILGITCSLERFCKGREDGDEVVEGRSVGI